MPSSSFINQSNELISKIKDYQKQITYYRTTNDNIADAYRQRKIAELTQQIRLLSNDLTDLNKIYKI